jgi:phosphatidylglycerophosphate synthase
LDELDASMNLHELREIVGKTKEPFWISRLTWRRISFYATWLCVKLHISANIVTIVSFIAGMAGAVLFCWRELKLMLTGLLLIYIWWFLDHIDGEVARYEIKVLSRKRELSGDYLDVLVHRWVLPLIHLCLGIGLMRTSGQWWYVLIGAVAASAYVGFTRTEAASLALAYIVCGTLDPHKRLFRELWDLGRLTPDFSDDNGRCTKLEELARQYKVVFAYLGCLMLLATVIIVDIVFVRREFFTLGPVYVNATLIYLVLTGLLSVAQHTYGTLHVVSLFKSFPLKAFRHKDDD